MVGNKEHHILNKAKLTEMVRSAYKDDKIEIIEYKVSPAAAKGEGYTSEVNKVDMTVKGVLNTASSPTVELHWVCKTMMKEPMMPMEVIRCLHMEDKEIDIYSKVGKEKSKIQTYR